MAFLGKSHLKAYRIRYIRPIVTPESERSSIVGPHTFGADFAESHTEEKWEPVINDMLFSNKHAVVASCERLLLHVLGDIVESEKT